MRSPLVREPPPGLRFQQKDTEQFHVCIGAPGIARSDRRRFAASLLDAILGGSASSRLFQEIREKRGMAYTVYSFGSQYTDTGLIGIYVGTREENLVSCLEIVAEQIADIAAGNLRERELERAKENLKGRIALSMESTSNRMSRLGRSLITDTELLSLDRVIAEIDAVEPSALAELAGVLLEPERLSAAGIGPSEDAVPRGGRAGPSGPGRRGLTSHANRAQRSRAARSARYSARRSRRPATSSSTGSSGADAMVDFTRPDAVVANVDAAVAAGRSVRRRHERRRSERCGWSALARRGLPVFHRAELRARGRADDAFRRRGGAHLPARRDRRAAPRDEGRRALGDGEGDGGGDGGRRRRSTPSACPGSSPTRRCSSAGRASC